MKEVFTQQPPGSKARPDMSRDVLPRGPSRLRRSTLTPLPHLLTHEEKMLLLLRVATELQRRHDGWRRKQWETAGGARLTCPLDVVHTLLDEEGDGPVGGHQVLQGHAEVVALPGSPGGGVQRLEGLGWFLRDRRAVRREDRTEADRSEGWGACVVMPTAVQDAPTDQEVTSCPLFPPMSFIF